MHVLVQHPGHDVFLLAVTLLEAIAFVVVVVWNTQSTCDMCLVK